MKVVFISPLPPPNGGLGTWTQTLVKNGLPEGHDFKIVNSKILGKRVVFDKGFHLGWELCRTVRILSNMLWMLVRFRPQIVHINTAFSVGGLTRDLLLGIAVRLFGKKLVILHSGSTLGYLINDKRRFFGWVLKGLLKITHINIFLNEPSRVHFESLAKHWGIKAAVLKVLPGFVPDSIFMNQRICNKDARAKLSVLFVGGLALQKGIHEIFQLAEKLGSVEFNLIGHSVPDAAEIIRMRPLNLTLVGSVSGEELRDYFSQADVFLFPSHTEGFPTVVTEAMSFGLPIVATNVGAIPEMIDENLGGFLFNVGDVDGMMRALTKLEADRELCLKMGEYNRNKALSEYAYSKGIKKLTDLYEELIKE